MKGSVDRFGVEVLDERECYRLIGAAEVGRLGVIEGGVVLIFPINYQIADDTVVFRTAPGSKLRAARRSQVTFQVDVSDPGTRTGWSVMVRGRAEEITRFDAPAVRELLELPVDPWAGEKPVWMRIVGSVVTGRRLGERTRRSAASSA